MDLEISEMTCLPSQSKCEWNELKHFVKHYNEVNKSAFERERCTDIENRGCPQPEILCRDAPNGNDMVIERKFLIWPPDYVEAHKNQHDLFERTISSLDKTHGNDPFTLFIEDPPNERFREQRIELAQQLADAINESMPQLEAGQWTSSETPFPWRLRKEHIDERDEDEPSKGLKISTTVRSNPELENPDHLPQTFVDKLREFSESCESKFKEFGDSKRILVLQLIPGSIDLGLTPEWWQRFFSLHVPSTSINEIWTAVDYGDDQWSYENIYVSN